MKGVGVRTRLIDLVRSHRMFTLVLVAVLVLLVIPMGFIIGFFSTNLASTITGFTIEQSKSTLNQLKNTVSTQIGEISISFAGLVQDDRFAAAVNEYLAEPAGGDRLVAVRNVDAIVESYLNYLSENVRGVVILGPSGRDYYYRFFLDIEEAARTGAGVFGRARDEPNRVLIAGAEESRDYQDEDDLVLLVERPERELWGGVEYVVLALYPNVIEHMMMRTRQNRSSLSILDDQGLSMISGADEEPVFAAVDLASLRAIAESASRNATITIGGERRHVVVDRNSRGWLFVEAIPAPVMAERIYSTAGAAMVTAIVILSVFLVAFVMLLRFQLRPLIQLADHMKGASEEALVPYTGSHGARETSLLADSYNELASRIRTLIDEVREREVRIREAEIETLVAQINPHFVINTLNCIRIVAKLNKAPEIERMLHTMCRLMAKSFETDETTTVIADELAFLRDYVEIMKLRYGDIFDYEAVVADAELESASAPRFLLQPLVENAIVHGIVKRKKEGRGRIVVRVSCEPDTRERLEIVVEDNGAGITSEPGEVSDEKNGHHFGIGLRSVRDRVQFRYGEAYGIKISSANGDGTRVRVSLPFVTEST